MPGSLSSLTIGDFSRATHLSIKTLRYYHRVQLLEPAQVDHDTGYRRYTTDQIPVAQVIRRFRDLEMPIEHIQAVLRAPDLTARNRLIADHLSQLEQGLARTQQAVASLRDLLADPSAAAPVSHRRVDATMAAAVSETVDVGDLLPWFLGALGELYATLDARGVAASDPPGASTPPRCSPRNAAKRPSSCPPRRRFRAWGASPRSRSRPPNSRSSRTPARTPTWTAPTARWPRT